MSLHVLTPGLLTTVQDNGRSGFRHLGVGNAGAADAWSHALANLILGNTDDAATLEITLAGPTLRFDASTRIALCGARIDAEADGTPIEMARPVELPAGSVLKLGACHDGARSYLAVDGGLPIPKVLGSLSTDLRGGFGGMRGRALAAGDVLPLARSPARDIDTVGQPRWWIDTTPDDHPASLVRVLPGEADSPIEVLCEPRWRVDAASNRQGLRLSGPPLQQPRRERISEPVFPGTVQLPPDGAPIVLMADAQTHGGYPHIGHVIRADWPKLAQLRPGDALSFALCDHGEARRAWDQQRQRFARIRQALAARSGA